MTGVMIGVQTVVQSGASPGAGADSAPGLLLRQEHRVEAGTSIRTLLCRAGMEQVVARIESGAAGLACHGKRAWLDDILEEGGRVEVVELINADAKAARAERVAADRARRRAGPGATG